MDLLTSQEVGKMLKVSLTWVYRHQHELGVTRVGRLLRFPPEAVHDYLESKRKRLALPVSASKGAIFRPVVCHQGGGQTGGGRTSKASPDGEKDPNRHGLRGSRQ